MSRKDNKVEKPPTENTITVSNQGPLYVRGDLEIDGSSEERAALCRCGESTNKPFCDNSHEKLESFTDRGAVGKKGEPLKEKGGKLIINRAENGPLLIDGNLTILAGNGREAWQGTKTALCRCGSSENLPFCDGAHKRIGFKAN